MTLDTERSKVPSIHMTTTADSQISFFFYAMANRFKLRLFWDKCTKWPWTLKDQRYPIYMWQLPLTPNFTPFCTMVIRFWVTGHLRQMHLITPKWLKSQRYPHHIHVMATPESKISFHFPLQPLPAIWTCHSLFWDKYAKWPWTLTGQRYPIHISEIPQSPKFHSVFAVWPAVFE